MLLFWLGKSSTQDASSLRLIQTQLMDGRIKMRCCNMRTDCIKCDQLFLQRG